MLSFAYSLLTKEFTVSLAKAGLEPLLGVFHRPRFGRPALALDLMEEFRPLIADSTVVSAINTGVISEDDFVIRRDACNLSPAGRKKFLYAYERRMDQLVTHPTFDYRISYRRVVEVQCRVFGRLLLGEASEYPAFRTR
jgi:CRISPR-associated protein Cas1